MKTLTNLSTSVLHIGHFVALPLAIISRQQWWWNGCPHGEQTPNGLDIELRHMEQHSTILICCFM